MGVWGLCGAEMLGVECGWAKARAWRNPLQHCCAGLTQYILRCAVLPSAALGCAAQPTS